GLENTLPKARPVPEFRRLVRSLRSDEELQQAIDFFRDVSQKADFSTATAGDLFPERALAALLRATAFLVRYELVAVRSISVDFRKGTPAAFHHYLGKLYANQGGKMELKSGKGQKDFYYSQSIVLTAKKPDQAGKKNQDKPFLSLSPLIIDLNNYQEGLEEREDKLINVFTYSYSHNGRHYYHSANRDVFASELIKGQSVHTKMSSEEFLRGNPPEFPMPAMLAPTEELLNNLFTDLKL
ncbi:MAG: hypothetical protein AAGA62_11845, partial [Bacteroidota bacterium]